MILIGQKQKNVYKINISMWFHYKDRNKECKTSELMKMSSKMYIIYYVS